MNRESIPNDEHSGSQKPPIGWEAGQKLPGVRYPTFKTEIFPQAFGSKWSIHEALPFLWLIC
jgi:hypothetical protein